MKQEMMGISDAVASAGLYAYNVHLAPTDNHINIGVASYGALGHMPPPLLTSNNVFFATSLWSYTKYDSNLLYQITSGLCVLQILKLAHFSILLKK